MEIGVVKWFNNAKGFGFISAEGVDTDIFAHYSAIEMDGYRSLKAGQRVQFEVIHGDKGSHATKFRPWLFFILFIEQIFQTGFHCRHLAFI